MDLPNGALKGGYKLFGPLIKMVMNRMWRANGEEICREERAIFLAIYGNINSNSKS
jgi:hypothetical protein